MAGTWKDLTDSVNSMASNLTGQVRNIAEVATAVASGDFRAKSRSTCAAKFCSSKKPSTRWWISCARSLPKSRAWRAKSAPTANWAARRWCRRGGHLERS